MLRYLKQIGKDTTGVQILPRGWEPLRGFAITHKTKCLQAVSLVSQSHLRKLLFFSLASPLPSGFLDVILLADSHATSGKELFPVRHSP